MATKGMKKLLHALKFLPKKTAAGKKKESPSPARSRDRELIVLLERINLYDPQARLSPERVRELGIKDAISYAIMQLSDPRSTAPRSAELYDDLVWLIKALQCSVQEGLETTARYCCTALIFALRDLGTLPDFISGEQADALMALRMQFFNRLVMIVKSCIEEERRSADLHLQLQREQEMLAKQTAHYRARRDSGQLDMLLDELERKAGTPDPLSTDALALQQELTELLLMRCSILHTDSCIKISRSSMDALAGSVARCYHSLTGGGEMPEEAAGPSDRWDPSQVEQQIRDIRQIIDSKDIRRILQAVDTRFSMPVNP